MEKKNLCFICKKKQAKFWIDGQFICPYCWNDKLKQERKEWK